MLPQHNQLKWLSVEERLAASFTDFLPYCYPYSELHFFSLRKSSEIHALHTIGANRGQVTLPPARSNYLKKVIYWGCKLMELTSKQYAPSEETAFAWSGLIFHRGCCCYNSAHMFINNERLLIDIVIPIKLILPASLCCSEWIRINE